MAYILKNTTGLINTRVTDTGRQKMSEGNFNIDYFQIGDSEICYNCINGYDQTNNYILEPNFNSQNSTRTPYSNKQNVKYPMYVQGVSGNTYGIPFMASTFDSVYNTAAQRGFFSGSPNSWNVLTTTAYTISSDYKVDTFSFAGGNQISLVSDPCNANGTISVGDFITLFIDETAVCGDALSCYPVLTFRITGITAGPVYELDRNLPILSTIGTYARALVYPSGMTVLYDTYTPQPHWYTDVIDFESVCTTDAFDVDIWNMNIPWTETPAGINTANYVGYDGFGSIQYIGTKDYLGYNSQSGQTDSGGAYYFNSFGERVYTVIPLPLSTTDTTTSNINGPGGRNSLVSQYPLPTGSTVGDIQKTIAIVHYTNNTIDYFYGEKFATEPYDSTNPNNTQGLARNFQVSLPWLSWHKSPTCTCSGQTFYIDPQGFDDFNLFQINYVYSNRNEDMNDPGIRYYNLWDTNPNINGFPNRVGKVFPDQKIIVFDDEEIVAAMSYKSNRSWTLPAPKISLITPNVCEGSTGGSTGVLSADTEYLYVTYRLEDSGTTFNTLHCNYYQVISGPSSGCSTTDQCVSVRFGNEFPCLHTNVGTTLSGFTANRFSVICQKVVGESRPNPYGWKEIDFTSQLSLVGGQISASALTSTTFVVCTENYNSAPLYDLSNYINLTQLGTTGSSLNFGDEYYFYGTIDTDITATIYEMKYLINMGSNQYTYSSNPTWTPGQSIYFTEIGLYDSNKDLLVVSKFQSPVKRLGVQQALVKFDF